MDEIETAEEVMRCELEAAGFDPARPDPRVAWAAFRRFISRPLPGLTTVTVGVECVNYDDRDDVLWLEFARSLEAPDGAGWNCGCLFSRTTPAELSGVSESLWWWAEHGTLAEWAADVGRLPAISACLALDGWRFEGLRG